MTLNQIPECTKVKVVSIKNSEIQNRLLGLGLVSGAIVEVVRTSPMGDPRMYRIFNKLISMRNSEARTIEVELLDDYIPLIFAKDGIYKVSELCGGRRFFNKMSLLNINIGTVIEIKNGNIIVNGSIINLGGGVRKKIILRRL